MTLIERLRLWFIRCRIDQLRGESDYHASLARRIDAEVYDLEKQCTVLQLRAYSTET